MKKPIKPKRPKKPIKSEYSTESTFSTISEYDKALEKYNKALEKYNNDLKQYKNHLRSWNLENNPERLEGESKEDYSYRKQYFKNKINKKKSPLTNFWEKNIKQPQSELPYFQRLISEIATSPIDIAHYLSTKIDIPDTEKLKTNKQKKNEDIEFVDNLTDASALIAPWNLGAKAPSLTIQAAKKFGKESIQEMTFDTMKVLNDNLPTEQDLKDRKKQKYSFGTGKNGVERQYIQSPNEALIENDIALARAKDKSNNNALAQSLGIFGNMALQYGTSMTGGTSGIGEGMGEGFKNIFGNKAAFGGPVGGVNVEVEGKEVGETPNGQLINFKGPSHEDGGININLPEGTEIFSDRIKVKGKTMAERKIIREKKLTTLEKLLNKNGNDIVIKNSIKRTQENNKKEEEKDQRLQDIVGGMEQLAQFAYGTGKEGVQKLAVGGTVGDFFTNIFGEEEKDLPSENKNIPNFTGGDILGLAGTMYSAFAPMNNTQSNRAGDTPNVNLFEDFGNDSLDKIDQAKTYVSGQRDKALTDLETSRTRSTVNNRKSARGVNTQRALDLASDVNTNNAQNDIYDNFSKQMMQLLSQQAGFENQQDQAVMTGEQQRDLADRQDRDNYYTQMAEDISTKGQGIQMMGKMFNENKANTAAEQAVNDSSINFKYTNGVLTDKAGNVVMNQIELAKSAKILGVSVEDYINMINKQKNG